MPVRMVRRNRINGRKRRAVRGRRGRRGRRRRRRGVRRVLRFEIFVPQEPQIKQGPRGPQGATGPRGIKGVDGLMGVTGATGPASPLNILPNGTIVIGDSNNEFLSVFISGDATLSNTGVLTLIDNGVMPGIYTNSNITVDSTGRITSVASGAGAGLPNLTNGNIWIGNATTAAIPNTVSGDATLSNTGVLTLNNSGVTPGSYVLSNVTVDSKGLSTNITANGTVTETQGGTNNTSYTTGDILYASAANTLSSLGIGTNTRILTSNGTIPSWQPSALSFSGDSAQITQTFAMSLVPVDRTSEILTVTPSGGWVTNSATNEWSITQDGLYTWRAYITTNGTSAKYIQYLRWNNGVNVSDFATSCESGGTIYGTFYRNGTNEVLGGQAHVNLIPGGATTATINIYITKVF